MGLRLQSFSVAMRGRKLGPREQLPEQWAQQGVESAEAPGLRTQLRDSWAC